MGHDFAAQQAETVATYKELQAEHGLPDVADIDYFFVADADGADWNKLADRLAQLEFDCAIIEAEAGDPPYLVATLPDQAVSASGIWFGEEIATRAALELGFSPDGWGLEG
ncbi:ribonuclease E inhibitor RraB [Rhodobacteraceae bacterium D3-12]|nr:ribonuclease E inhibitor RraB [Rhodobacteraceae bacterium D3-12]